MRAHPAHDTKGKVSVYQDDSTSEQSSPTKTCSCCKEEKSATQFNKHKGASDGLSAYCKGCRAAKRKEKPWYNSPRAKAYMREYSSAPEEKQERREYAKSERGKETSKERFRRYYQNNKHKVAARDAVGKAIKSGLLPHPTTLTCACGNPAAEYHHHLGYEREHWLDVVALCDQCHDALHYNVYKKKGGGISPSPRTEPDQQC